MLKRASGRTPPEKNAESGDHVLSFVIFLSEKLHDLLDLLIETDTLSVRRWRCLDVGTKSSRSISSLHVADNDSPPKTKSIGLTKPRGSLSILNLSDNGRTFNLFHTSTSLEFKIQTCYDIV